MQPSRDAWPSIIKPYRHFVRVKGGIKEIDLKLADGAVGIVIPMRNKLPFFKLCFYSVLDFTDHPYTLTIVDHLGDLSTKQFLNGLTLNHQIYMERYDQDFNFAAEVNLGIRSAFKLPEVKYALILNADCVVEPAWLSKMMSVINANERIGIVGPLSNKCIPEQMDMEKTNKVAPAQRVSGMCMLIRRELFEQIGGFDEQFVGGGFEDWDFCERARRKGWHVVIDGRTYIHHFWRQFRQREFDKEMKDNEARFFAKHPLIHDLIQRGNLVRA